MATYNPENERIKRKYIVCLTAAPGIDAVFCDPGTAPPLLVPPYNCAIAKRIPRFVFRVFLSIA
jgi:hypothetical protein